MSRADMKGHQNSKEENKELVKEFFQIENQVQSYKTVKDLKKDNEAHKIDIEAHENNIEALKKDSENHEIEI